LANAATYIKKSLTYSLKCSKMQLRRYRISKFSYTLTWTFTIYRNCFADDTHTWHVL